VNEVFRLVATIKTNAKTAIGELKAVEKTGKTMGARLGKTMKTLAKVMKIVFVVGAAAATYAMGKFFVSSIKSAAKYEQAMAMVQAVTGATGEEFDALGEKAKDLGKSTKFTMIQIAEGMENLGRAGMTANEIIDSMGGVTALAASQCIELGQAAEMVAGALNGFNLAADQAGRVADVYAYAASNSAIRTEDLAETLKYAMPAANALGYSLEEVAGMAMILGDNMIKGSMAGTGLSFAFSELVGMSDEFQKQLGDVGVSVDDLTGPDGKILSMAEILGVLKEKGLDAGDMFELFGKRAGKSMVILLDKGEDAIKDYTGALEECGGTAEEMAEIQLNTLSGQLEILKGSWELLKVTVGEKLMPVLKDFLKNTIIPLVNKMVDWAKESDTLKNAFTGFFDKVRKGIEWIVEHRRGLVTALKAIAVGFAAIVAIKIATWIGGAISGFASLAGVIGVTGPLGIAIAAATAGLVLLLRKVKGAVEETKKKAAEAREEVKHLGETIDKTGQRMDIEAQRWNARAGEMAESSKELARVFDTVARVMGEKLYELVETAKMPESAFHSLVEELRKAAIEASKAPVAKAGQQWGLLADAILSKYSEIYPELAKYREGYLGDLKTDLREDETLHTDSVNRIIEIQALRWEALGKAKEGLDEWRASREAATCSIEDGICATEEGTEATGEAVEAIEEHVEASEEQAEVIQKVTDAKEEEKSKTEELIERFQELDLALGTSTEGTAEYANAIQGLQGLYDGLSEYQDFFVENNMKVDKSILDLMADIEALGVIGTKTVDYMKQITGEGKTLWRSFVDTIKAFNVGLRKDTLEEWKGIYEGIRGFLNGIFANTCDMFEKNRKAREDYEKCVAEIREGGFENEKELLDEAAKAYEEERVTVWGILKQGVRDFIRAIREKFVAIAAEQAALGIIAALTGNIIGALAHGAAALKAGAVAVGLAVAGFQKGVLAFGPTLGVIGEGGVPEAAIPLTPPILADIGKGIVSALQGVEPAYAGAGIGGAQVVIEEMHIAEGAIFHVREEADIEKIVHELGDEFEDRIIGVGRVKP